MDPVMSFPQGVRQGGGERKKRINRISGLLKKF
jgi:hypothetical protein